MYKKPNLFFYRLAQGVSNIVAKLIFKRKYIRNEIKGKKGPFIVIANHEAALDFVNLIGATSERMSFVISNSFYNTLPIKKIFDKVGVIPKQQFQTNVRDLKMMKAVLDAKQPLVIYPAGLMCEDGLSTPIPGATYKFLKMMKADVYVARTKGTYFVTPKWGKGMRTGRTTMDIYKLFSKEELKDLDLDTIQAKTDEALLYDAYREQEQLQAKYKNNDNLNGLEQVLYQCPHCHTEFSISVKDKNTLYCSECGYSQTGDIYGFLHKTSDVGDEIRYVSDWSQWIHAQEKNRLRNHPEATLTAKTKIHMIDFKKNKFIEVGEGSVTIANEAFTLTGQINGEYIDMQIPIISIPTLPFKPGRHFEIQDGNTIYRCVLDEGTLVMKFIHMLKSFYELR